MYALVNCDIYTGDQVLHDKGLMIEGARIASLVEHDKIPSEVSVRDLKGACVAPGFIDLQVNGGGGVLLNDDPSPAAIGKIVEAHRRLGTTSILPTLITSSRELVLRAIAAARSYIKAGEQGVLGLHVEGPYINEKKAGVHDKRIIRGLNQAELEEFLANGRDIIKIITLAPECVSTADISRITDEGIRVSAGHSDATFEEASEAFRVGVSCVTHLFNAMSAFEGRKPGLVGAYLAHDEISGGVIADGHHVHLASIGIVKRLKPKGTLFLVTDAMPPVGYPGYNFRLGDLEIFNRDGKCVTGDGTLAGSALDLATAVRNCIQKASIPMEEALRMATLYPAKYLGLESEIGMIRPGMRADLVIFDNQIHVKGVVVAGHYEDVSPH